MGLDFRKVIKLGKTLNLNIGKRGASVSKRAGLFTFNSRGKITINLGKGFKYTINLKKWK